MFLKLYYIFKDWTIIRPGGLKSEASTGNNAFLTENTKVSGVINRADVAALILKALGSDGKCTRRVFSAIDPSLAPPINSVQAFTF